MRGGSRFDPHRLAILTSRNIRWFHFRGTRDPLRLRAFRRGLALGHAAAPTPMVRRFNVTRSQNGGISQSLTRVAKTNLAAVNRRPRSGLRTADPIRRWPSRRVAWPSTRSPLGTAGPLPPFRFGRHSGSRMAEPTALQGPSANQSWVRSGRGEPRDVIRSNVSKWPLALPSSLSDSDRPTRGGQVKREYRAALLPGIVRETHLWREGPVAPIARAHPTDHGGDFPGEPAPQASRQAHSSAVELDDSLNHRKATEVPGVGNDWILELLADEADRPARGVTGVDPSLTPFYPGSSWNR